MIRLLNYHYIIKLSNYQIIKLIWPRSTMDSIRASEAPDAGSIPAEATENLLQKSFLQNTGFYCLHKIMC